VSGNIKRIAATELKDKLGKDAFESLLRDGNYAEVCDIAKAILGTNLVFKIEKAQFRDGIKNVANHEPFANALYDLLHGSREMEAISAGCSNHECLILGVQSMRGTAAT
jgi:hypothetical protein